tara:strand:+ start:165 stop:431 length:267 start_codon:yes stop_codon:yes gene_type:complete
MDELELEVYLVKELKMNVEKISKTCEELLEKIDRTGIDNHYSINDDIFEKATNVYKISALLGYIKTFKLKTEHLNITNVKKDNNKDGK